MHLVLSDIIVEPYMIKSTPSLYCIQRLNLWSDKAWAVIEMPSGAIASDIARPLLMRMRKCDAKRRAQAMNATLRMSALGQCSMGKVTQAVYIN